MRKIKEENKQEGIELQVQEEVQVGDYVLEEGDKVLVYPNDQEQEKQQEEQETSEDTEKD